MLGESSSDTWSKETLQWIFPFSQNDKKSSINNSQYANKYILFLTERIIGELRPLDISDRMEIIVDISKVMLKEEAKANVKQSLVEKEKEVSTFDVNFNQLLKAGT